MPLDQRAVAGGPPRRVQRHQIERRRVGGAVVRRVRDQLEMRQLAVAQLVQDLARLGVAVVVALLRLVLPQHLQRARGEFRIDDHRLQRDDQRVAAEQCHEPRQPGGGHEHHVVRALQRQPQGGHVLHTLIVATIEFLVAGIDLQHRALPLVHLAGMIRCRAGMGAFPRRSDALRAIHEVVDQAAMPGLPGLQRDVEAQPPVGVHRRPAVAVAGADDHLAAEILVAIGDAQHLPLLRPRRGDAAAPHDLVALHLEDVGEIGADRDLQVEANRILAVVGDLDILVQPAIDMAADHQAQRARRDRPVLAHEGAVGLEDARRMVGDGAAIQQVPRLAVGIDRPGADHPGVAEIQPAFAGPVHLPVGFGHQHRLSLVDGDLRRADLNLERHPRVPFDGD